MRTIDQWFSERMPTGRQGTVAMDGDKLVKGFDNRVDGGAGAGLGIEFKTHGQRLANNVSEKLSLRTYSDPDRFEGFYVVEMDGNTPEPLHHFPVSCPCCGLPEQPIVNTEPMRVMRVHPNGIERLDDMSGDDFVVYFNGKAIWNRYNGG